MAEESGTTRGVIDPGKLDERPADAVQLVGPEAYSLVPEGDGPCKWVFQDGVLTASPEWDSVLTKDAYRDFRMHVEFNVNEIKDAKDPEKNGNSGVYIQQRYEIQILNSFGVSAADYKDSYCGSIYRLKKPDRIVCKPAGEWQSYDIVFRAARFDGDKKTENARITVYQNGVLIHDDFAIPRKTGVGKKEGPEPRSDQTAGTPQPGALPQCVDPEAVARLSGAVASSTLRPPRQTLVLIPAPLASHTRLGGGGWIKPTVSINS